MEKEEMHPVANQERVTAAAINVSSIFFPYMGPIIGVIVARKSKFARYHAFRCLVEEIFAALVIGFFILLSLGYSVYAIIKSMESGFDLSKIDWGALLIKSLVTWILLALWGAVNTILSIRDTMQALHGNLPDKPKWTERTAMRLAGISSSALTKN